MAHFLPEIAFNGFCRALLSVFWSEVWLIGVIAFPIRRSGSLQFWYVLRPLWIPRPLGPRMLLIDSALICKKKPRPCSKTLNSSLPFVSGTTFDFWYISYVSLRTFLKIALHTGLEIAVIVSFPFPSVSADYAVLAVPRVQDMSTCWKWMSFHPLPLIFFQDLPVQWFAFVLKWPRDNNLMKQNHGSPTSPNGIVASNVPRVVVAPPDSEAKIKKP